MTNFFVKNEIVVKNYKTQFFDFRKEMKCLQATKKKNPVKNVIALLIFATNARENFRELDLLIIMSP